MIWPQLLSFSRVLAGPVVAALVLYKPGNSYLVAAVIFSLASFTDLIDGKLARYSQTVSPLGIFLDTTADKVMVSLVLIGMAIANLAAAWIVLVIIGREFIISGLRSYAASQNRIISAHIWGKGKALITMVAIIAVLLAANGRAGGALEGIGSGTFWQNAFTVASWLLAAAAISTIISGARYIVDAWPLLRAEVRPTAREVERRARIVGSRDG